MIKFSQIVTRLLSLFTILTDIKNRLPYLSSEGFVQPNKSDTGEGGGGGKEEGRSRTKGAR